MTVSRLLAWAGIDHAIGWTAGARVWSIVAGPVTLLLIASRLSSAEQGFYYTFASVVALQVFVELGLSFVLQQFASHEMPFLEWRADGTLGGDPAAQARLAALLRKATSWYGIASVVLAAGLLIGGTLFLASKPSPVTGWLIPWFCVAIAASLSLSLTPLFTVLEGCGRIADVARVRTFQAIAGNAAAWTTLLGGGGLFAAPAVSTAVLVVGAVWLYAARRKFFRGLFAVRGEEDALSWSREVWPFQWRVAVSFMSGYFIFQLFTPVLFASEGPVSAGRMGMSFVVVSAMFTIAMSWVSTKVPVFGGFIARREFAALDALFFPTLWRSLIVMALGCAAFFGGVLWLRAIHHPWAQRVLDPLPLGLFILTTLANYVLYAEAVYLRAHKEEPFLKLTLTSAVLVATSTVVLGRLYGAAGMMAGFFAITTLFTLGAGTWIFVSKRKEWHS